MIRNIEAKLTHVLGDRAADTYIVGGTVRDRLLERDSDTDLDLVITHTNPEDRRDIARNIARVTGGAPVLLHEETGTYRIGAGDTHLDVSFCSGPVEADLERRDFTLNAIAAPLIGWEESTRSLTVIAPHGGWDDLHNRKLRAMNCRVFQDDPVRLLRAVRIAAHLGLRIDAETAQQAARDAHLLAGAAPERITEELLRILEAPEPHTVVQTTVQMGLLETLLPGVAANNDGHWQRTLATLEAVDRVTTPPQKLSEDSIWHLVTVDHFDQRCQGLHSRRTVLKLAVLLQGTTDIRSVRGILGTLRVSKQTANLVARIAAHRNRLRSITNGQDQENLRRIYHFFRDAGDAALDTVFLALAEHSRAPDQHVHTLKVRHILEQALRNGVAPRLNDLPVNGQDLMNHLEKPPGPWLTPLLERIDEARATGEINSRSQALQMADRLEMSTPPPKNPHHR